MGAAPKAPMPLAPPFVLWCLLGLAFAEVKDKEVAQIKCAVCELAMAEAHALAEEKKLDRKNEDTVIDFVDSVCVLSRREGRWLRRLDVQNVGDRMRVENMSVFGECRHECQMVRKACQVALKNREEDIVEALRESAPLKRLKDAGCKKTCGKKPPKLDYKRKDEEWMQGADAGMLEMLENREKLREETGQVLDIMKREDME